MTDKLEHLNYDDAFVMELMVSKVNEIIDKLEEIDERLNSRVDNLWKYQRIKQRESEDKHRNSEDEK